MYLILFVIFGAILTLFLKSFYVRQIKYKALSNIPGPPSNFLWGNLFDFNRNIEDSFDTLNTLNTKYGSLVKLWPHPWRPLIVVAHPKFIERIVSTYTHLDKTSLYNYLKPFLGKSLATSEVEVWKRDRKFINTAFQPKIFETFVPVFEYHGNKLANILKKDVGKTYVDLPPFIDLYVLDVICELMTNVRKNFQETSDNGYLEARSKFLTIFMNRAYSCLKRSNLFFSLTSEYETHTASLKVLKNFSRHILESRKEARKNKQGSNNGLEKTMVDLLLDIGTPDSAICDHIDTFIVAGHDTPGSTISFALYELSRHQSIQNRVLEESVSILGKDPNAIITIQDMQEMTYLECVIKETLRYHSPIQAHERTTEEDITIDGITIPKGTEVSIALYALQRSEEYFPNADVFNPDRFLPENVDQIQPYTFMPFSKGPRDCIGKTMAMLLMKSVISKTIRNFELLPAEPAHKIKLTSEFVLKSATGLPVKIKSRTF